MLRDWQNRFLEGVRHGADCGDELFSPAESPSLAIRFAVYREGYWLRVSESLIDDFPLTGRLLGTAIFVARLRDFLAVKRGLELELGELTPAFADFLLADAKPTLARALRIDLLATEARRAPDPVPVPGLAHPSFGLHPSSCFFREGARCYALWRANGSVRRERISPRLFVLLECFREPAGLEELSERLGGLGEEPDFVQGAVAEGSALGLIVSYSPAPSA